MIDLEKGKEKLNSADSFLTKLKAILKKHWGIILLCLVVYFFYWALTTDPQEVEALPKNDTDDYYIKDRLYIIDDYGYRNGDTVYIDYYSDGYVEKYYIDGEIYDENI